LPAQIVAGDEASQAGVKGCNVIVLEIDLNESLPVVVALVILHPVQHVARKVELRRTEQSLHVGGRVAWPLKEQPVAGLQWESLQVQARLLRKIGSPDQCAVRLVRPAVNRAYDFSTGLTQVSC